MNICSLMKNKLSLISMIKKYSIVVFLFFFTFQYSFTQAETNIEHLKNQLLKETNKLKKGELVQQLADAYLNQNDIFKANFYIDSAIFYFNKIKNDTLLAKSFAKKGIIKVYANQIDSGIYYYLQSNQLIKKYKDSARIFSNYMYVSGLASAYQRNYVKALRYIDTAELYLLKHDKKGKIYNCLVKGGVYLNLQEYNKALEITNLGIKLSQNQETSYYGNLLTNKGIALDYSKDYERAEYFHKKAISNSSLGEKFKGISLYNLSQVKESKKEFDSAIFYIKKSIVIFEKLDAKQEYFQSLLGQIEIYRKINQTDSATYYFNIINSNELNEYENIQYITLKFLLNQTNENALNVEKQVIEAKSNNYLDLAQTLSEKLYYYYKKNGNVFKSLKFLELNREISDSLLSQQKIIDIQKQEARIIIEAKNEAIHLKEKENLVLTYGIKSQKLISYIFIISFFLLLVFVLFLRKSIKAKKQEIAIKVIQIEKEQVTRKLSESNLTKAKELIQEKNQIIKTLESESTDKIDTQQASEALINKINTNNEWAQYMTEFEMIYPNFVKKVIANSIDKALTKNEIRLLTLIKLNLANKEIAEILFISHESVKKSKQRLVKKFNLQESQKLSDYIISI